MLTALSTLKASKFHELERRSALMIEASEDLDDVNEQIGRVRVKIA